MHWKGIWKFCIAQPNYLFRKQAEEAEKARKEAEKREAEEKLKAEAEEAEKKERIKKV